MLFRGKALWQVPSFGLTASCAVWQWYLIREILCDWLVLGGYRYWIALRTVQTSARFLSLNRNKLRLCLANHRPGYFSNLAYDCLSIVWSSSRQETENGLWRFHSVQKSHILSIQEFPLSVLKWTTGGHKQGNKITWDKGDGIKIRHSCLWKIPNYLFDSKVSCRWDGSVAYFTEEIKQV